MKANVSLWSANLLDVGADIDRVDPHVDGFHIDVTDGHLTPQLLFGPDFVAAVRQRTARLIDVHLMVADADAWVKPFIAAGADMVTVHARSTPDLDATIRRIETSGALSSLAVEADEPIPSAGGAVEVDRLLLMGTAVGIKGADADPAIYSRVADAVAIRDTMARRPDVFVDGGIREHTVGRLAAAGADGVVPGSLVYGAQDPNAVLAWLRGLRQARPDDSVRAS